MNTVLKYKYEYMLLFVAMLWGGGFVTGKLCLTTLTPLMTMTLRFSLSSAGLFLLFRKNIIRAPRPVIISGLIVGLTQFAAQWIQLIGLQYTTSAKQSFLVTSYVVIAPFASWIVLRTRPGLKAFFCAVLTFTGLGCICLKDDMTISPGDLISLFSAVIFAFQVILISRYMNNIDDSLQFTFFQIFTAAVCSLLACIFTEEELPHFTATSAGAMLYLALINTMVGFVFQSIGQKHVSDVRSSLILSCESVFGLLFSVIIFGGELSLRSYLGCAICFISIIISCLEVPSPSNADRNEE